jgi:hypothetical protein
VISQRMPSISGSCNIQLNLLTSEANSLDSSFHIKDPMSERGEKEELPHSEGF